MSSNLSGLNKAYLHKTNLIHITVILLSTIAVYWPVYNFKFLNGWDDQWFITNHYTQNDFSWKNISSIFSDFYYGQYAPLNQLYYTIVYSVFKYNTGAFHLLSLFIHLINSVLVYNLIRNITADISDLPAIKCKQVAFIAAFLFAVLPVNIEPVAWVAASKVILYTLFYLLAMGSYRSYILLSKQSSFYLALLFFMLSFGFKEQAVLFPLCMLLMDHIYGRNLKDKMVWLEKMPFFILSVLFGIVTIQSQNIDNGGDFYSIYQRVPLFFYSVSEYITKCIIPVNLSYLYPFPFLKNEPIPCWMWLHVFAIPVIIYCFYKQIGRKWFLFGFLFFVIHILLVSNIFSLARFAVVADRYAYLSSIGICFIIAYALVTYAGKLKVKRLLYGGTFVYMAVLMIYGHNHLGVWNSAYNLKEKLKNTIEKRNDFKELKRKAG
ncbi:MAG: hypothetical protein JWQ66_1824 [Mucilaginibacter sp.]|nr:hypothetical protein [Mucilaginibacter sp.]